MDRITITDVTLREYGQNISAKHLHIFTPEARVEIALGLMDAGFKNIELFSCINPKLAPAMEIAFLSRISKSIGRVEGVNLITLVPNRSGYETFKRLEFGSRGFNHTMGIFFSAVEAHNLANLGRGIEETIREYRAFVPGTVSEKTRVAAYISAAFGYMEPGKNEITRPDPDNILEYIYLLLEMGAGTVTLSDLQGVADQAETGRLLGHLLDKMQGRGTETLGYHPHNVSGITAVKNSRTAYDLGIRRFDASLGGTGGCLTGAPGNQPTEGLVSMFEGLGVKTGLDGKKVAGLTRRINRQLYSRITLGRKNP